MRGIAKKYAARVEHWDDERSIGNSLIVTLKPGWYWLDEGPGCHVRGFDTVAEAKSELRDTVPCLCQECRGAA